MIEAIDDDIIQLKIDSNKKIIIENPKKSLPKNLKSGDYINIITEKENNNSPLTQAKALIEIINYSENKNLIKFNLLNENTDMILNGNIKTPQIKNFLTWLGKFIKNIKLENLSSNYFDKSINKKSINNFIKTFIKEIAKSIIENKNLKIPAPKDSAQIIENLIEKTYIDNKKNKNLENILKNENQKNIQHNDNKNLENSVSTRKNISNINNKNHVEKNSISKQKKNIENLNTEKEKYLKKDSYINKKNFNIEHIREKTSLHKIINTYKTFSQFEVFQEPNFIFFQLFGIPIFLNVDNEIRYEGNKKEKINRISFSFISNNFGLINTIIYKKEKTVSLNFFVENNLDFFKNNISELINSIQEDGMKIEGLQINSIENNFELNKKGLYG